MSICNVGICIVRIKSPYCRVYGTYNFPRDRFSNAWKKCFSSSLIYHWCILLMLYWDVAIALTCRGNIDTYHWIWESEEIQDYLPLADWIGILQFYFSDPTAQWFLSRILSATVNKWINILVLKITHLWTYHNNYKYMYFSWQIP